VGICVHGQLFMICLSCGEHTQFSHKFDCIVLESSHIFEIFISKERNRAFCCEGGTKFQIRSEYLLHQYFLNKYKYNLYIGDRLRRLK
jgi:hypothetical protein